MKEKPRVNRNVILTGCTSFFTDISSEMLYPLMQAFVSAILASRAALVGPVLGIIEGVAESAASLLKVASGYYSDRIRNRKVPAITGYGLSALAKILLFFASAGWYLVLVSRLVDRVGKGIRSAPRDALIAESTPPDLQGRAFGLQRAMDFAGATVGVLLLYLLSLRLLDHSTGTIKNLQGFYSLFAVSIVPAVIGVVFLFFVREPARSDDAGGNRPRPNLDFRSYERNLRIFFLAQMVFTLGNSSNQFLLLRSMDMGCALPSVVLMYLLFNLSSSLLSHPFGALSDRIGFRKVLIGGYALYAVVYAAFGLIPHAASWLLWIFWPIYGSYYAMTEGVEKAFVSSIAPADSRATALGFLHTIVGIGLLPASIIAGALFVMSPAAPFLFGACTSIGTIGIIALGVRPLTPALPPVMGEGRRA
ncbi:MAG: MFS transporter [Chitinispirillaceae bacterium]|nr:MFS transporter [Chitinispirillaceae bacterium]